MMPDWGAFWPLMGVATAIPVVMMAGVWVLARLLDNAGVVDFLVLRLHPVVLVCAAVGGGDAWRNGMLAFMVSVWAARLGTYLLVRVARHHPEEDGRYAALRAQFPRRTWRMFFGFFEAQAVLIALLSVPFVLVFVNPAGSVGIFEWTGAALWVAAMSGEAVADAQLSRFRSAAANRGKTCRSGLWRFSRHPVLLSGWCGSRILSLRWARPGDCGLCSGVDVSVFDEVTGIKATEEHAVRSRGRITGLPADHQRVLPVFPRRPWFPRPPAGKGSSPDVLIRAGIRQLLARKLKAENRGGWRRSSGR